MDRLKEITKTMKHPELRWSFANPIHKSVDRSIVENHTALVAYLKKLHEENPDLQIVFAIINPARQSIPYDQDTWGSLNV